MWCSGKTGGRYRCRALVKREVGQWCVRGSRCGRCADHTPRPFCQTFQVAVARLTVPHAREDSESRSPNRGVRGAGAGALLVEDGGGGEETEEEEREGGREKMSDHAAHRVRAAATRLILPRSVSLTAPQRLRVLPASQGHDSR